MTVAGSCHKRSDDIAMAIAEGHHFVAFHMLVPAESELIASFLSCRRRSITVDDADVEVVILLKLRDGACKNGIKAPMGFEASKRTINSGVVDLRLPIFISVDR
ncbi:MAG: hypothetical protein AAFY57_10735 [Cyanobacteria bacterium J06642_2]